VTSQENDATASPEPLHRFRLVSTSEVDQAEAQGSRLLSTYRLGIEDDSDFNARVNGVSLGSVSLYYMDFGHTGVDVISRPLDGFFGLTLPITGTMQVRYRGREFAIQAGRSAALISPDSEFRMLWSRDFSVFCVRLEKAALDSFAQAFCAERRQVEGRFEPIIHGLPALRSVWGVVDTLHTALETTDPSTSRVSHFLEARLREQLMTTLLVMQPNTYLDKIPTRSDDISRKAVRQAVQMVESESHAELTVVSLAQAVGVSVRTLQLGFQRDLDTTPATFLRQVRLARAHEDLVASRPGDGVTVAGVANRWGFHHVGRFAGYYRDRFGESPSTTLLH